MNLDHILYVDASPYPDRIYYTVNIEGTTTYDYGVIGQEPPFPAPSCPAFEIVIAQTNIDRVFYGNSSADSPSYEDYPIQVEENKYQVCCSGQISLNDATYPWHSFIRSSLLDSGLAAADCDDIVQKLRNSSDTIMGNHQHNTSGRVMIPTVVVAVDFIYIEEDGYNGVESDYGANVGPMLDASFLDHQVATVPASDASIRGLEKVKAIDHGAAGLMGGLSADTERCAICLDDLLGKEMDELEGEDGVLIRMPCKHMFHQDCIITWLKRNRACPLCRYELPAAPSS